MLIALQKCGTRDARGSDIQKTDEKDGARPNIMLLYSRPAWNERDDLYRASVREVSRTGRAPIREEKGKGTANKPWTIHVKHGIFYRLFSRLLLPPLTVPIVGRRRREEKEREREEKSVQVISNS